jgi:hypothetical protein
MMSADDVFCCTEPPRKDPKSAFAVVAAVCTAPFSGHIREDMAVIGGFYSYAEESVAVGPDGTRTFFVQSSTTYSTDLLWIIILKVIE